MQAQILLQLHLKLSTIVLPFNQVRIKRIRKIINVMNLVIHLAFYNGIGSAHTLQGTIHQLSLYAVFSHLKCDQADCQTWQKQNCQEGD